MSMMKTSYKKEKKELIQNTQLTIAGQSSNGVGILYQLQHKIGCVLKW